MWTKYFSNKYILRILTTTLKRFCHTMRLRFGK